MSEVTKAIQYIAEEKGLSAESVLETIQAALAAAYRKDFGNKQQNIQVIFDPETQDMKVWDEKTVVEDADLEAQEAVYQEHIERKEAAEAAGELFEEEDPVRFNPKTEMMLTDALVHEADVQVGDIIKIDLEVPAAFGRMAAQTAKQVIIQKLREAERENLFGEFKEKEGELVTGTVQRRETRGVLIDFGRISGIMPPDEQIKSERYTPGARIKVYVVSVAQGGRGPEIVLSRAHKQFVARVFEAEIPEIASGTVEIKGIARDAGFRSKVAVWTDEPNIDPIGSCIGQRGSRISVIIDELGGEKVDIIQYDEDSSAYIAQALSPAKVGTVALDERERVAAVTVSQDQFSLAIGRGGQNVRLAAALTGWKINVVQEGQSEQVVSSEDTTEEVEEKILSDSEGGAEAAVEETAPQENGAQSAPEESAVSEEQTATKQEVPQEKGGEQQ